MSNWSATIEAAVKAANMKKDGMGKRCTFMIEVYANEDWSKSTVAIGCDNNPPPAAAVMVTTEHLMTLFALQSDAGFERALALLVEGAKTNKTMGFGGTQLQ